MSDLESIRKRHEAIIPGPWRWFGNTATDQVYLATTDRGRLIILSPEVRKVEYVYHHNHGESYALSKISNTDVRGWCPAHREDADDMDMGECLCQEIADFLRPTDAPEELGYQTFEQGNVTLTRGLSVHADLRFAVALPGVSPDEVREERRKRHGGWMRSYREMARYEVLGRLDQYFHPPYRTRAEYEAEFGEGTAENRLYREDFIGLANPEATFIEHAPEDISFLLGEIERLGGLLDSMEGVTEKGWWR